MQLIATRTYPLDDFTAVDLLYRKPNGRFVLNETSDNPNEPERKVNFSLAQVYQWLREQPWEIERAIVRNPRLT
jgi:hypothetical protein